MAFLNSLFSLVPTDGRLGEPELGPSTQDAAVAGHGPEVPEVVVPPFGAERGAPPATCRQTLGDDSTHLQTSAIVRAATSPLSSVLPRGHTKELKGVRDAGA